MRQDRNLYIPVAILIGLIGEFPTHGLANGQRADEPSPPLAILIQKNQKSLAISGIASSAAHEVKLRQTALQYFGDLKITVNLSGGARTPRGWALVTEMVLRALEHTDAARASISASIISIQGVTTHKDCRYLSIFATILWTFVHSIWILFCVSVAFLACALVFLGSQLCPVISTVLNLLGFPSIVIWNWIAGRSATNRLTVK